MGKKFKIVLVILGVIILLLFLSFFGIFGSINQSLNSFVAGTPNINCNVDSDCTLKDTSCGPCDCGSPVNKEWNRFCPLPNFNLMTCEMCRPRPWSVVCINNQCEERTAMDILTTR